MFNLLMIFIGGGLGSLCRFGIAKGFNDWMTSFPLGTFLANLISCIILGYLVALTFKNSLNNEWRLLLMTGFCGGFSTFSTFSMETFQLFETGQTGLAFLNILGSIIICLIGIYLGMKLGSI